MGLSLPPITFASLLLTLSLSPICTLSKEEFVPGAMPLREPDNRYPTMYSSVVPLLYKFHLPNWDTHSMKIQFWKNHNNCTENDQYSSGYPCPVLYHMHPTTDQFRLNMTSWRNLFTDADRNPYKSEEFLLDPSILSDARACSKFRPEPHFRARLTSSNNINEYIQAMTQCAQKNETKFNLKTVVMSDLPHYLEEVYHTTFASFTSDYWNLIKAEETREAATLVAWTALQVGLMTHQNMEAQKWAQAVETCKNGRIPWTVISGDSLQEQLSILRSYLASESQDLAVPLEDIQKYFQFPISDCIFGEDDTFLVRIMVPVVPKDAAGKNYFVKYHPISFMSGTGKMCSILEGAEGSVPFNIGLNGLLPCTCDKSSVFCKGWTPSYQQLQQGSCLPTHMRQERCIHALASESEEDIILYCNLECKDPPQNLILSDTQLVIHQSHTTTIRITPAWLPKGVQFINCPKGKVLLPQKSGAYEVTLPDRCDILVAPKNSSVLNGMATHIDLVQVDHLMPYHWRHGEVVFEDDDQYFHEPTIVDQMEKLVGLEPKVSLLAGRLQEVDDYCRDAGGQTWIQIFVIFSCILHILLGAAIVHLYLWKVKQINDTNRFTLLSNAADFPISDDQS